MDPLEYAIRRYRELATPPVGVERYQSAKLKNLRHWLENEVCQAISGYLPRAKFQREASWAVRNLTRGAASDERKAIEKVDNALIDAATRLLAIVQHPSMPQPHPVPKLPTKFVKVRTKKQSPSRLAELRDLTVVDLERLVQISNRFWNDLAFAGDYFAPRGGLHGSRQAIRYGEFMAGFNLALPTVGDMISACLLQRVNILYDELKGCRNKCLNILRSLKPAFPEMLKGCEIVLEDLDHRISTLKELVQVNPYSPRSACIALTQLFLIFNSGRDVTWLGLDEQTLLDGPPSLTAHLTNQRNTELYDAVAVSLDQLKMLYQNEPANQSALEEAIATGNLVIHEKARKVYWELKIIDSEWHKHPKMWALLIALARATRLEQSVNDQAVYGDPDEPKTSGALTQLVSRLKRVLPASLRDHVAAVQSTNSYRLSLDNNRVHFIQ
jgi:hypothetical protein